MFPFSNFHDQNQYRQTNIQLWMWHNTTKEKLILPINKPFMVLKLLKKTNINTGLWSGSLYSRFCFLLLCIAGIFQTHRISHNQHRRESFAFYIIAQLLPKEFTSEHRKTLKHSHNVNNTDTHFTNLGKIEGWKSTLRPQGY